MEKFIFITPIFRKWQNFISTQLFFIMFILIIFFITQTTYQILYDNWILEIIIGTIMWILIILISIFYFSRSRFVLFINDCLEIHLGKITLNIKLKNISFLAEILPTGKRVNDSLLIETKNIFNNKTANLSLQYKNVKRILDILPGNLPITSGIFIYLDEPIQFYGTQCSIIILHVFNQDAFQDKIKKIFLDQKISIREINIETIVTGN